MVLKPAELECQTQALMSWYADLQRIQKDIAPIDFLQYALARLENLCQLPVPKETLVETVLSNLESTSFAYPDVETALQNLTQLGDEILIWTQGSYDAQLNKAANLGFAAETMDTNYPDVYLLGEHLACISTDKIASLKPFVASQLNLAENNKPPIFLIIDDKLDTLLKVTEQTRSQGALVCAVWMRRPDGSYRDKVPTHIQPDQLAHILKQHHIVPVENLSEFVELRRRYGAAHQDQAFRVVDVVDLDHTTFQTVTHRRAMCQQLCWALAEQGIILEWQ